MRLLRQAARLTGMSNNRQRTQETLASLSAGIEPEQREWMDAEILRRSTPGDMWNISRLIRFLIDFYRASDEYASVSEEGKL